MNRSCYCPKACGNSGPHTVSVALPEGLAVLFPGHPGRFHRVFQIGNGGHIPDRSQACTNATGLVLPSSGAVSPARRETAGQRFPVRGASHSRLPRVARVSADCELRFRSGRGLPRSWGTSSGPLVSGVLQMSNNGYLSNLGWVLATVLDLVLPSSGAVSPTVEWPSARASPSREHHVLAYRE